mmetsp:Transcript_25069/g.55152  ORF Transcript_25069/g.55152 Transcript_25069/m.55152 type:complete len:275 (-) Transcript_25069:111-935(-)
MPLRIADSQSCTNAATLRDSTEEPRIRLRSGVLRQGLRYSMSRTSGALQGSPPAPRRVFCISRRTRLSGRRPPPSASSSSCTMISEFTEGSSMRSSAAGPTGLIDDVGEDRGGVSMGMHSSMCRSGERFPGESALHSKLKLGVTISMDSCAFVTTCASLCWVCWVCRAERGAAGRVCILRLAGAVDCLVTTSAGRWKRKGRDSPPRAESGDTTRLSAGLKLGNFSADLWWARPVSRRASPTPGGMGEMCPGLRGTGDDRPRWVTRMAGGPLVIT